MKDATRIKARYHTKQVYLSLLQESSQGETAAKELDNSFRGSLVESLESFEALLVVMVEDLLLSQAKNLRRETTEQLWCTVQKLDTEGGSRVATLATGKAYGKESHEGSFMGRNSCQNIWQVSMYIFHNTNMFCFIPKGYFLLTKAVRGYKFPI